ncbi:hypothetical protein ACMFMG_003714 [Clarireedia jacksonii]
MTPDTQAGRNSDSGLFAMDYRPLSFGITMEFMAKTFEDKFIPHAWFLEKIMHYLMTLLTQFRNFKDFIDSEKIKISVSGTRDHSRPAMVPANPIEGFVYHPVVLHIENINSGTEHAFNFVKAFHVYVGVKTPHRNTHYCKTHLAKLIATIWALEPELNAIQQEGRVTNEVGYIDGEASCVDPFRMTLRECAPLSVLKGTDCTSDLSFGDIYECQLTNDHPSTQKIHTLPRSKPLSAPLSEAQRLEIIFKARDFKTLYELVTPSPDANNLPHPRVPSYDWPFSKKSDNTFNSNLTMGFRHHEATLDPERVANWTKVCTQVTKYAIVCPRISQIKGHLQRHMNLKARIEHSASRHLAPGNLGSQDAVKSWARQVALFWFLREICLDEQADFYWNRFKDRLPISDNVLKISLATPAAYEPVMDDDVLMLGIDTADTEVDDDVPMLGIDTADTEVDDDVPILEIDTADTEVDDAISTDGMEDWLDDKSLNCILDRFYGK